MANKESDAQEYLKKHCLMELFENLTTQLIYERPEDPKTYMKQFLEKLRDARTMQRNYPCIFDDSNVRSLFGMLDVTGEGFITYEQYKQGLETMGVKKFDRDPPGGDLDRISAETFLKEGILIQFAVVSATFEVVFMNILDFFSKRQGLTRASATFSL